MGSVWRGIDLARRVVLNLIFLAVLVLLVALAVGGGGPEIPDKAALVIAPQGIIVEQLSGDPVSRALDELTGDAVPEVLLSDLQDAIRAAADDERIGALFLELSQATGGGLSKLQALRASIDEFKTSGKPVIANADFYAKSQYYLASTADEVYLHPMGMVLLDGYGRFRNYYKEGLDRLEVDWNVFRVGEYKSAVEPYLRNSMSDEAKQANLDWLGDLWSAYVADVAAARNLSPAELEAGIARFNEHLRAAGGNASEMALRLGLVDQVGDRDAVRQRLIELVGEDEDNHSFRQVGLGTYLETLEDDDSDSGGEAVAVLVARGAILNGEHPPGTIGGDSTAALIRDARFDDDVAALVLRVDSGGGSAFASEVIREELAQFRAAGKNVVVSMASVAASGGYWIATASDEIWASPTTITGSIGIFGMLPTFEKPLAKYLGTRVDGVGTTWLAGALRVDRALDPELGAALQRMTEQGYEEFLERVAQARGMSVEEVDQIARGRVWSGADAHRLGLVDQLGDLDDAIASAAAMAELGDDYRVEVLERELGFTDRLMADLVTVAASVVDHPARLPRPLSVRDSLVEHFRREAELLAGLDDPYGIYAHCLCEVE